MAVKIKMMWGTRYPIVEIFNEHGLVRFPAEEVPELIKQLTALPISKPKGGDQPVAQKDK